jgi:hypothetical protein
LSRLRPLYLIFLHLLSAELVTANVASPLHARKPHRPGIGAARSDLALLQWVLACRVTPNSKPTLGAIELLSKHGSQC